nr:hypothetical protein BaRGS_023026 [Batillaria attramentaria]
MGDVGGNPNYGFTNFDHIGWALLTSFQLLTLDYWEDIFLKQASERCLKQEDFNEHSAYDLEYVEQERSLW